MRIRSTYNITGYRFRDLTENDADVIREMFYYSIFVPPGETEYPKSVIDLPELVKYHASIGANDDFGVVCEKDEKPVGAIWGRYFTKKNKGYGFINSDIPELSMAVLPDHRNKGIGNKLLTNFIEQARQRGCKAVSLSVDKRNRAKNLYLRSGFDIVHGGVTDYIMQFVL